MAALNLRFLRANFIIKRFRRRRIQEKHKQRKKLVRKMWVRPTITGRNTTSSLYLLGETLNVLYTTK